MRLNLGSGSRAALPAVVLSAHLLGCRHVGPSPRTPPPMQPPPLTLAEGGAARLPIVIAPDETNDIRKAALELADFLHRITGAAFEVVTGDGSTGIVVGTIAQFPDDALRAPLALRGPFDGREAYSIRTEPGRLRLIGATGLGTSHAVFRLLQSVGCRWFFPAPAWTVIPSNASLRVALNEDDRPALLSRRIWYGYGAFDAKTREDYDAWARHNRMAASLRVSCGHAWQSIILQNQALFDEHPEYLALVTETPPKDAPTNAPPTQVRRGHQLCVSNPDVQRLAVEHALKTLEKNPAADMVSMECSDGLHHCECEPCLRMGTVSDRAFFLANTVAREVARRHPGKMVGMLAYSDHSEPPKAPLEPNVYVQLTAGFTYGRYTFAELMDLWPKKCRNLGFYDYFSVWLWDFDRLPGGRGANVSYIRQKIAERVARGASSLDFESGNNWGPHGRGYYLANRLMWDPGADADTILGDFYEQAFGPAAAPIRRYYERFDPGNEPLLSDRLVGLGFRDVEEACRLAADRPDVMARLDDIRVYLRYVHLRWMFDHEKDKARRKELALAALTHVYRTRRSYMNHWGAIRQEWCAKLATEFEEPSWDWKTKGTHPWAVESAPGRDEIEAAFREGLATFPTQEFQQIEYSATLTPVSFEDGAPGALRQSYQGGPRFVLYSLRGEPLSVRVTTGIIASYRNRAAATYRFVDAAGRVLAEGRLPLDGQPHDLNATVRAPGPCTLEYADSGAGWACEAATNALVALPLRREKGYNHLGQMQPLFFYVPKGVRTVAYFWRGGTHEVRAPDGSLARRVEVSDTFVEIPVADGQDGHLWSFQKMAIGHLWFFNVPNVLSASARVLLLPEDVARADGLKAPGAE